MAGMKHDTRTCTCPDCTIQRAFERQARENYATKHGDAQRIALMACDALIRQSAGRDDGQEAIDLARMALGIDPIRPTQRLCGHRGCTLRSGHIPGHTDR